MSELTGLCRRRSDVRVDFARELPVWTASSGGGLDGGDGRADAAGIFISLPSSDVTGRVPDEGRGSRLPGATRDACVGRHWRGSDRNASLITGLELLAVYKHTIRR